MCFFSAELGIGSSRTLCAQLVGHWHSWLAGVTNAGSKERQCPPLVASCLFPAGLVSFPSGPSPTVFAAPHWLDILRYLKLFNCMVFPLNMELLE